MMIKAPAYIGFFEYVQYKDAFNLHFHMGYPAHRIRIDFEISSEHWEAWPEEQFDKYFTETTEYDKLLCVESCRDQVWEWKPLIHQSERDFYETQLWFENDTIKANTPKDLFNLEYVLLEDWATKLWADIQKAGL